MRVSISRCLDGWQSGRLRTLGKRVCPNRHPGFESLPIRHSHKILVIIKLCDNAPVLKLRSLVTSYYNRLTYFCRVLQRLYFADSDSYARSDASG
jgi:hypothetical protein